MPRTADVVVIGGGIMGCSTAFQLAKRGLDVVLLEKDSIGTGSTGRSSAIIRQHYSNELTARMALHSLRVFQRFDDEVGGECGFQQTGWLGLAGATHRKGIEANVALQQGVGIDTRIISSDELAEIMPGIETRDVAAVAYERESGYADPHLTTAAYADAARRHRVEIRPGCEVTGVRFRGDRVVGVDTTSDQFDAPVVVNCAGPWGARVAAAYGITAPINACRIQMAVFRRPAAAPASHPVVIDFVNDTYLRSETGHLTLVGSIDPAEADAIVDPDDYPEYADDAFVADIGEKFVRRCPNLDDSEVTRGYSGLYAVTPDWHPIIDEVPAGSGCYLCAGFSGHGFKLGPAVGLMMADRITEVADPLFPTDLFRFDRFAEGKLVRGLYEESIIG